MKKISVYSFVVLLLAAVLAVTYCAGMAENETWDCTNCGRTGNTGNFCGSCAAPAPWNEDETGVPEESADAAVQESEDAVRESAARVEQEAMAAVEAALSMIGPTGAAADGTDIPEEEIPAPLPAVPVLSETCSGVSAHLRELSDQSRRVYSYAGPGKAYVGTGGYKPFQQRHITAWFEEDGWVLADVSYSTAEERFVYLPAGSFDSIGSLPSVSDMTWYAAETAADVVPVWGPDDRFSAVPSLTAGQFTKIRVLFQENGFVYAEYMSGAGKVRMWLPAENIEMEDAQIDTAGRTYAPAGVSNFKPD